MGLVLDAVTIGVLVHKKDLRNGSSTCFNCCDIVVLIISIIGCVMVLGKDWTMDDGPVQPEEWDDEEDILAFLVMGVA